MMRMKVSTSWVALRETLEKLPAKRMNLETMKITDLPKQTEHELEDTQVWCRGG